MVHCIPPDPRIYDRSRKLCGEVVPAAGVSIFDFKEISRFSMKEFNTAVVDQEIATTTYCKQFINLVQKTAQLLNSIVFALIFLFYLDTNNQ